MLVLVTGALGNIGTNTWPQLVERGHSVRLFDLRTEENERRLRKMMRGMDRDSVQVVWGNIRSKEGIQRAVDGVDCIVHLAAIIPPGSERDPAVSYTHLTLPTKA